MSKFILTSAFILFINFLSAQENWFISNPDGSDFYLTTTIENNRITGLSRKKALIDIVGHFKYTLVKMTTELVYPEIVYFEGSFKNNNFNGKIQMLFDQHDFIGSINNDSLKITLTDKKKREIELKGIKINKIKPIRDYKKDIETIIQLTENDYSNQKYVKENNWLKFKKEILKAAEKINDDLELEVAFGAYAKALSDEFIETVEENTKKVIKLK